MDEELNLPVDIVLGGLPYIPEVFIPLVDPVPMVLQSSMST